MKKQTGFTLIELMITLVVLAVVATIATPAIQQIIARSAVTSATNDLVTALQVARSQAIREGEQWQVLMNSGNDPWLDVFLTDVDQDDRARRYSRNENVEVAIVSGDSPVIFDSRGVPTDGAPREITLEWRGVERCVSVSRAGRIRSDSGENACSN